MSIKKLLKDQGDKERPYEHKETDKSMRHEKKGKATHGRPVVKQQLHKGHARGR